MINEKVRPNEVKKGMYIRLKDGRTVTVEDNQRGIIRRVSIAMPGFKYRDYSTQYVDEWWCKVDGNNLIPVEMTEPQREQMKKVRVSLDAIGW